MVRRLVTVLANFEQQFADFGLKIIGPSIEHLFVCAEILPNASEVFLSDSDTLSLADDDIGLTDLHRSITRQIEQDLSAGVDRPVPGRPKTTKHSPFREVDGLKTLLTGDMQLAKAEVSGLRNEMENLLTRITERGLTIL